MDKKSLIIYFSRADENYFGGELRYIDKGNTEVIAEYIKEFTGADIFKVEPLNPYSKDYMTCIEEAKDRTRNHQAPIKKEVGDISTYDVIYIGSPIYWGGMPEEMFTALSNLDFTGKGICWMYNFIHWSISINNKTRIKSIKIRLQNDFHKEMRINKS